MYSRAARCAADPAGLGPAASASTCTIARSAEKLAASPPCAVGGHMLPSEAAVTIARARIATIGAAESIARGGRDDSCLFDIDSCLVKNPALHSRTDRPRDGSIDPQQGDWH